MQPTPSIIFNEANLPRELTLSDYMSMEYSVCRGRHGDVLCSLVDYMLWLWFPLAIIGLIFIFKKVSSRVWAVVLAGLYLILLFYALGILMVLFKYSLGIIPRELPYYIRGVLMTPLWFLLSIMMGFNS